MDEIRKIPPVTRTLTLGTAAVSLASILQLVSPYRLILLWPAVTHRFEIWRLATAFLLGGSGLQLLFDLFLLYSYSSQLETAHFLGKTADMTWSLSVICAFILALSKPLNLPVLNRSLLLAIVHFWAQTSPEQRVSLYGFISIPAKFLSFALLGLDVLMGGPMAGVMGLTGVIAAQAWWYLDQVYPRSQGGRRLPGLSTPRFLRRWLGNGPGEPAGGAAPRTGEIRMAGGTAYVPARGQRLGSGGGSTSSATQTQTAPSGSGSGIGPYTWGRGNRLGSE